MQECGNIVYPNPTSQLGHLHRPADGSQMLILGISKSRFTNISIYLLCERKDMMLLRNLSSLIFIETKANFFQYLNFTLSDILRMETRMGTFRFLFLWVVMNMPGNKYVFECMCVR